MAPAIIAVAAAIGTEFVAVNFVWAAMSWATIAANAALSFAISLVSESLQESPGQQSASLSGEIANRKQLIRASASPRRVIYGEARVSGSLMYAANGTDASYVHFVIALAGHRCNAINGAWLGDEQVGELDAGGNCTSGRFADHVRIVKYLGTDDQVMDPDLAAACPEWGAKNRPGRGICYVYMRITRSRDVFPQGLPTPRFDVQGKADILDVRDGSEGYNTNAALCTLDWLLWQHGFNCGLDEVVQSAWQAAANVADEDVALPEAAGGGTQKRYAINGSFTLDRGRADVLDKMRQAMAGAAFYTMGQWYGHAGAADTSVMDITERDLRGPYRIRPRVPDDKVYNAVKGTYTETTLYTETDFPPITNSIYEAQDGGERIYKDVRLPFENDAYRAQRLAKTDLERHRQGVVVDLPMRIKGIKLRPWNIVRLSLTAPGFENKLFRVIDWKFQLIGGADVVLEEYADAIYTWSSLEATLVDPAPDTTLPDPFTVAAPGVPTVTESLYETTGSAGAKARATVAWVASADPFVVDYLPEYRVVAAAWVARPAVVGNQDVVDDIAPGRYEFRVRSRNALGVISTPSGTRVQDILGLTAAPGNVVSFSVIKANGVARGAWMLHADLDVRQGGAVVVRHAPVTVGASWESSIVIEEFAGNATSGDLALMTGTYLAKARDSSSNYSAAAVGFVVTEGMVTGFTTVGTLTLSPAFAGSKTNVGVVDAALQLISAELFDADEDIDGAGDIDDGVLESSGRCDLSEVLDLATSAVRRVQVTLAAAAFDVGDFIDADGDIDSGEDIDGTAINDCDVTVYCATTDDDPSGAPTWSAWQPFFVGDFNARALKFRVALTAGLASHNIAVSALSVTAKIPA